MNNNFSSYPKENHDHHFRIIDNSTSSNFNQQQHQASPSSVMNLSLPLSSVTDQSESRVEVHTFNNNNNEKENNEKETTSSELLNCDTSMVCKQPEAEATLPKIITASASSNELPTFTKKGGSSHHLQQHEEVVIFDSKDHTDEIEKLEHDGIEYSVGDENENDGLLLEKSKHNSASKLLRKKISSMLQNSVNKTISGGMSLLSLRQRKTPASGEFVNHDFESSSSVDNTNVASGSESQNFEDGQPNPGDTIFPHASIATQQTLKRTRTIFALTSVFSKAISGWRRNVSRKRGLHQQSRANYSSTTIRPLSSFSKRQNNNSCTDLFTQIPEELWRYGVFPYLEWMDLLRLRCVGKWKLTIIVQEQEQVWKILFSEKMSKYFQQEKELWKSHAKNYFFFDLDEAIIKEHYEKTILEKYTLQYRKKFAIQKDKCFGLQSRNNSNDSHHGISLFSHSSSLHQKEEDSECPTEGDCAHYLHKTTMPESTPTDHAQEDFVYYLSCSRSVHERKQQVISRKKHEQQQILNNNEHRSAWLRIFTLLVTMLSAVAAFVCLSVKDFAFSKNIDMAAVCGMNHTSTTALLFLESQALSFSHYHDASFSYLKLMDKSWTIPFVPIYIAMLFILGTILYFWIRYSSDNTKFNLEGDGRERHPNEIYFYMTFITVAVILFVVFLNIRMVYPYCESMIHKLHTEGQSSFSSEDEVASLLVAEVFANGVVLCSPLFAILGMVTIYFVRSLYAGIIYRRYVLKFHIHLVMIGVVLWKFIAPFVTWVFTVLSLTLFILYMVLNLHPLVATIPIMLLHLVGIFVLGWIFVMFSVMLLTCAVERSKLWKTISTLLYSFLLITLPVVFYLLIGLNMRIGIVALPCSAFFVVLILFGMNYVDYVEDLFSFDETVWPFS